MFSSDNEEILSLFSVYFCMAQQKGLPVLFLRAYWMRTRGCTHVCYLFIFLCLCGCLLLCVFVFRFLCVCVYIFVYCCVSVCTYGRSLCLSALLCTYVCVFVCMHPYLYTCVCMYAPNFFQLAKSQVTMNTNHSAGSIEVWYNVINQ